ncbi:hypothetical protein AB0R12_39340 [Streptomyces niveus]|uniref:hypothetical protein n=1 Tax=Streptomyces niveus TaxID=193462 RepID=UPI0034168970
MGMHDMDQQHIVHVPDRARAAGASFPKAVLQLPPVAARMLAPCRLASAALLHSFTTDHHIC